jgi:phage tail-like protein
MIDDTSQKHILLDDHQGKGGLDGFRITRRDCLSVTGYALGLAPVPAPPVPLKDPRGTFGDLAEPTGVALGPDGTIYIADARQHSIFRLIRHGGLQTRAWFMQPASDDYRNDTLVFVPVANRLERWPQSTGIRIPAPEDIEIIDERVFGREKARLIASWFLGAELSEAFRSEIEQPYPSEYLPPSVCHTSIDKLPTIGGHGKTPRRLDNPRGLAVSPCGELYVADSGNHRIQIFDLTGLVLRDIWGRTATDPAEVPPKPDCFEEPEDRRLRGDPIPGTDPGEFNSPADVAIDEDGNVWIAEPGNGRVQKYDPQTDTFIVSDGTSLAAWYYRVEYGVNRGVRFVYIPALKRLELWPLGDDVPSDIADIDIQSDSIHSRREAETFLLRRVDADPLCLSIFRIHKSTYPASLAALTASPPGFDQPTHLAVDRHGRVLVADHALPEVTVLDVDGLVVDYVRFAKEIAGDIYPSAIAVAEDGSLWIAGPGGLYHLYVDGDTYRVDYDATVKLSADEVEIVPITAMTVLACGRPIMVGGGTHLAYTLDEKPELEQDGYAITEPLDSGIDQCPWHRVEIELESPLPSGCSVTMRTFTSQTKIDLEDPQNLDLKKWDAAPPNADDFLILSPPGRYLYMRIDMKGNGRETPKLARLRIYFPRMGYLSYLPAVYQQDAQSKDFLQRFLAICERFFDSVEGSIENMWTYFNADGVPADEFLNWLGSWIGMSFHPSLPVARRRALLRNAPELYRRRGTAAGLQLLLALALGLKDEARILEHFCLRNWMQLNTEADLDNHSRLWGLRIVDRLHLEENSRIGDFALIGTGDPLRDPFNVFAHRFSIFLPADKVRTTEQQELLRYYIDAEKPAHTSYTICPIEPRLRVGIQATVGLDTLIGDCPQMVLNHCSTLDFDSVVAAAETEGAQELFEVGQRRRVGVSTILG